MKFISMRIFMIMMMKIIQISYKIKKLQYFKYYSKNIRIKIKNYIKLIKKNKCKY